ncbi:MAG: zinc-ribbon domain-containing protein [Promethearchaeota archaeon]|nr:MAG: zinc-ribbon domain-containing protein [Candidatus Lokiarchaeota archaeon]
MEFCPTIEFCPFCGSSVKKGSNFCPYCSEKLE